MTQKKISILVLVTAPLWAGCMMEMEVPEDENIGVVYQPSQQSNDSIVNGRHMNGRHMNGEKLNSARRGARSVSDAAFSQTKFSGVEDGTLIEGNDFVDVEFDTELDDLSNVTIKIENITASGKPGLEFYDIKYYDNGSWYNICDNGEKAFPVHGRWNKTTAAHSDDGNWFTFACRGAALAKCVEFGYPQWGEADETYNSVTKTRSLRKWHQACTRMVRADYCGDGTSHTEDGTTIDVWDALDIMTEDTNYNEPFEAEWGPNGGDCIDHTRWEDSATTTPAADYIDANCPSRWASNQTPNNCGQSGSDFFAANNFADDLTGRPLLRNKSANNLRNP